MAGWEDLAEVYKKEFADDKAWEGYENLRLEREKFNIKVYPKSAWAVFNTVYKRETDSVTNEWKTIEARILEKVDGEWKITYVSNIATTGYEEKEAADSTAAEKEESPE